MPTSQPTRWFSDTFKWTEENIQWFFDHLLAQQCQIFGFGVADMGPVQTVSSGLKSDYFPLSIFGVLWHFSGAF